MAGVLNRNGRPKGSKNKVNTEARDLAKEMGVDPVKIMLLIASGDWEALGYSSERESGMNLFLRQRAAEQAAQYTNPKLKSITIEAARDEEAKSGLTITYSNAIPPAPTEPAPAELEAPLIEPEFYTPETLDSPREIETGSPGQTGDS